MGIFMNETEPGTLHESQQLAEDIAAHAAFVSQGVELLSRWIAAALLVTACAVAVLILYPAVTA